MNQMKIKAKRLSDTAKLPTYGSEKAACADVYADLRIHDVLEINKNKVDYKYIDYDRVIFHHLYIPPHETVKVPIGYAFEPPEGYMIQILQKSGLASHGIVPIGGIIDEDYRGEVVVILLNTTDDEIHICHGDKIAQIAIRPYIQADFIENNELSDTQRGCNGFGSTGK